MSLLGALAVPSSVCFLLTAAGLLLSVHTRTRKAALPVLALAGGMLLAFSSGKTATALLSPLEYAYPRVPDRPAPASAIVVLAAYAADDPNMSLSDRPNSAALYRVVEGALLKQHCPDCPVIVSGTSPTTKVMGEVLVSLGVPPAQVRLDNDAANIGASATNLRRRLGSNSFYLVTSAGHMPRSMAVLAKAGLHPLPAPTDHRLPKFVAQAEWSLSTFHLECSDLAIHERLGIWWYRFRGRI